MGSLARQQQRPIAPVSRLLHIAQQPQVKCANDQAGRPGFLWVLEHQGAVLLHVIEGRNLLEMSPDERAREGVFMAFQYPIEVPGVSNAQFLRLAYNEKRKHLGEEELDPLEFKDLLKERAKVVEMEASFMTRSVNEGFSGGEKKRNEILQMAVLEPKLAVLDETDSGLDIDALRVVANGVNQLLTPDNAIIVVTHYQRLLNYIVPDFVHVLANGLIVREGGKELALELESKGYDWIKTPDNGKGAVAPAQ